MRQNTVLCVLVLTLCHTPLLGESVEENLLLNSASSEQNLKRIVRIQIELGGDLQTASQDKDSESPVHVTANLQYAEVPYPSDPDQMLRLYTRADATIHTSGSKRHQSIRHDHRAMSLFRLDGFSPVLAAHAGPLTRDELDLIRTAGDPLTFKALTPGPLMSEGDSWSLDANALGPLLAVDSASLAEVTALVEKLTATHAKIRFAGAVHGLVDGAEVEYDLRGVALFDRRNLRFDQLNLAFHQKQSIGPATPGLNATCKVNVSVTYDPLLKIETPRETPTQLLSLVDPAGRWRLSHPRDWYVVATDREATTLRRVEGQKLLAQTTIMAKPPKSNLNQPTPAEFEQETRKMLGSQLRLIESTSQWTNAQGLRCMSLVAHGALPSGEQVEWRRCLVLPDEFGPAISLTTTLEAQLADKIEDADRELIDLLEIRPTAIARAIK